MANLRDSFGLVDRNGNGYIDGEDLYSLSLTEWTTIRWKQPERSMISSAGTSVITTLFPFPPTVMDSCGRPGWSYDWQRNRRCRRWLEYPDLAIRGVGVPYVPIEYAIKKGSK